MASPSGSSRVEYNAAGIVLSYTATPRLPRSRASLAVRLPPDLVSCLWIVLPWGSTAAVEVPCFASFRRVWVRPRRRPRSNAACCLPRTIARNNNGSLCLWRFSSCIPCIPSNVQLQRAVLCAEPVDRGCVAAAFFWAGDLHLYHHLLV